MGITAYGICYLAMSLLEYNSLELYNTQLDATKENLRRLLSDIYVATENNSHSITDNLDRPDHMEEVMERIIRQNPYILSCHVSFVESYYPQKGRLFQPYALRHIQPANQGIETRNNANAERDYLSEPWFTETLQATRGHWTKPFYENGDTLTPLVSYMRPVFDNGGRPVAVLRTDLSLKWLREWIAYVDRQNYGRNWTSDSSAVAKEEKKAIELNSAKMAISFIIDKDGTFLTHPDSSLILHKNIKDLVQATPDSIDDGLVRQMLSDTPSSFQYEESEIDIEGKHFYMLSTPIKHVNWTMGLLVPKFTVNIWGYALVVILIAIILIGLLVQFIISRFTIRRTAKPLTKLADSAGEIAQGHFDTQLPVLKYKDEISLLRDSFEEMQQSLSRYVKELQETTAVKASIESELKIAHDIQMSMLPKIFPPYPERNDIDIAGTLTPAKGIGGDLFDFYIREEQLFFCIGDVSGKGVPAALVMATTRSLFRNISAHESAPDKIINELNKAMSENNDTYMFVTLFVGVLDLATGMLNYSNAGHDAPLLIGRDVGILPCDPNLPVGIEQSWEFTLQQADIDSETTIFLFTDGLNEAENGSHSQFGDDRVLEVARKALEARQHQPQPLIGQMTAAVHQFVGDAEQSDDLTMLAIQYKHTTKAK
jgi:sigma-B regulation protein RsbU (phosphoserine phosphatase)